METPHEDAVSDTSTAGGGYTPQERKRYRKERRAAASKKGGGEDTGDGLSRYTDFAAIPTSLSLLTAPLRRQLRELAAAPRADVALKASISSRLAVPAFRVGTLEMYKRFPEAYEAFMSKHDCSKVRDYLCQDVIGRITKSSTSPSSLAVRVADFGCGTGRIGAMVAAHPSVTSIYAYDGEPAMLSRCLVNTVQSAKLSGVHAGVVVVPTAAEGTAAEGEAFPFTGDSASSSSSSKELEVMVRPCPFQSLQAGFLSRTSHRKCHLVVCAWSLSYLMRLQWGEARWHAAVDAVVQELIALLDTAHSDAAVVIIETLGSGAATPTRSNSFTQRLEDTHGFAKRWVRTDYTFESAEEAEHMTRFFFGERVAQQFATSKSSADGAEGGGGCGGAVWMECTGMWTLWKAKGS